MIPGYIRVYELYMEIYVSFILHIAQTLSDQYVECGSSDLQKNVGKLELMQRRESQICKYYMKKIERFETVQLEEGKKMTWFVLRIGRAFHKDSDQLFLLPTEDQTRGKEYIKNTDIFYFV